MNQQVMVNQFFPSPAVMQALVAIQAELKTLEKRLELVEQRRMAERNYLGAESYLVEEKNEPPDPQEKLPWTPTPQVAIDKEKPVKIVAPLSQTVMCIKQASMTTTQVLENHKLKRSFGTKEEQTETKLMGVGDSQNKIPVSDQKNKNGIIYSLLIKEENSVPNNSYNWNEQVLRTKLCQEGENDEDIQTQSIHTVGKLVKECTLLEKQLICSQTNKDMSHNVLEKPKTIHETIQSHFIMDQETYMFSTSTTLERACNDSYPFGGFQITQDTPNNSKDFRFQSSIKVTISAQLQIRRNASKGCRFLILIEIRRFCKNKRLLGRGYIKKISRYKSK